MIFRFNICGCSISNKSPVPWRPSTAAASTTSSSAPALSHDKPTSNCSCTYVQAIALMTYNVQSATGHFNHQQKQPERMEKWKVDVLVCLPIDSNFKYSIIVQLIAPNTISKIKTRRSAFNILPYSITQVQHCDHYNYRLLPSNTPISRTVHISTIVLSTCMFLPPCSTATVTPWGNTLFRGLIAIHTHVTSVLLIHALLVNQSGTCAPCANIILKYEVQALSHGF